MSKITVTSTTQFVLVEVMPIGQASLVEQLLKEAEVKFEMIDVRPEGGINKREFVISRKPTKYTDIRSLEGLIKILAAPMLTIQP